VSAPRLVWVTAVRTAVVCTETCMGACGQNSRCLHRDSYEGLRSGHLVSAPRLVWGTVVRTAGVCTEIRMGDCVQDSWCLHRDSYGGLRSGQSVSEPRLVWGTAVRTAGVCTEIRMGDCGQDSRCLYGDLSHDPPKEQSATVTRYKRWFNCITETKTWQVLILAFRGKYPVKLDYMNDF